MDFLQGITKVISDTTDSVKKKAIETAETAKLRGQLSDLNQEMERLYGQVGKAYYTARGSKESFASADAFCERIDTLKTEIGDLQRVLDKKRSHKCCKNCGAALSPQAKFCIECGEKVLPEDLEAAPQETQEDAHE